MNKATPPPTQPAPTGASESTTEPSPEAIAAFAYVLWEAEGRPDGRDLDHWLAAETQLRKPYSKTE